MSQDPLSGVPDRASNQENTLLRVAESGLEKSSAVMFNEKVCETAGGHESGSWGVLE